MDESRIPQGSGANEFDPCRSELERDPATLREYVRMLEDAFGRDVSVIGILEIGSYAKCEAVPCSDIDTRIYVTSPCAHLFNVFPWPGQSQYAEFVAERGALPRRDLDWSEFNIALCEKVLGAVGCNVEFGFVDARYAGFELSRCDRCFSPEHSLLFQSNVLYDPDGLLVAWRAQLEGIIFPSLARGYRERHLDELFPAIYESLAPSNWEEEKLAKSGQIRWVQWAVRCLRNAIAAKVYGATGLFIYKKPDVLAFCERHLPGDLLLIRNLYGWKTDPRIRAEMVKSFRLDPEPFYALFRACMPQLEEIVAKVRDLGDDLV